MNCENPGSAPSPNKGRFKFRGKIAAALMSLCFLPIVPISPGPDSARSNADYDTTELAEQTELKLVTANIHNQPPIQYLNFAFLEADPNKILAEQRPDVACFQEISKEDALNLSWYGDVIFTANRYTPEVGIALVATRPIDDAERPNLSKTDNRPALLATIDNLRFACVHLTNGAGKAEQELSRLLKLVEHLDILMGDTNLPPEAVNALVGEIKFSSPTNKSTMVSGGGSYRAIDRIVLPDDSAIIIDRASGHIIEIRSDHRGVAVTIKIPNWAGVNMREMKGQPTG